MILGVVIGFAGGVIDNIWWGFAWGADFAYPESEFRHFMFRNGPFSNTFARQAMGIMAGLCHLASAVLARKKIIKRLTYTGCILGFLLVLNLLYIRNF